MFLFQLSFGQLNKDRIDFGIDPNPRTVSNLNPYSLSAGLAGFVSEAGLLLSLAPLKEDFLVWAGSEM